MSREFDLGTYLCVIIFKFICKRSETNSDVLSMKLKNTFCKQYFIEILFNMIYVLLDLYISFAASNQGK